MFAKDRVPASFLALVKRHLKITWDDPDTDDQIVDMILDAEYALNHKLGAEVDYTVPGQERRLFLNYLLYTQNNCLDQFDAAYLSELYQIRSRLCVEAEREKNEEKI